MKQSLPKLSNFPDIYLDRLRKVMKSHCQDSQSLGTDLNLKPHEYKAEKQNT